VNLRVCEADLHLHNLHTRMPFKYGIATMTRMPMAFVRVALEINGRPPVLGVAADLLPPKWFTKDPARDVLDEIHEMLDVIETAMETAEELNAPSVFDLWRHLYDSQTAWAAAENKPPLLAHFGTSLVERAVMDAFCRAKAKPFHRAVLDNDFGIRLGELRGGLEGFSPAKWLPTRPHQEIIVRHTVGLSDPLTDQDIAPRNEQADPNQDTLDIASRMRYGSGVRLRDHQPLHGSGRGSSVTARKKHPSQGRLLDEGGHHHYGTPA